MVQMSLFAGQERRCRHREWTCGHGGGGQGEPDRETSFDIYTHDHVQDR